MPDNFGQKLLRGLRDPAAAWGAVRGRVRGHTFRVWCKLFRPRVTIGRNFFLDGTLSIHGPGRVIVGDNVTVSMTTTPWTYSSEAVIEIGDGVFLNGTRFGCKQRITVGNRSILAECRIGDYDFHSVDPHHRNDPHYIKCAPVIIEENVWIAADCFISRGITIGRNSTIGAMSVVRSNIPPDSIAAGNPAVVIRRWDDKSRRPESPPAEVIPS